MEIGNGGMTKFAVPVEPECGADSNWNDVCVWLIVTMRCWVS